MSMEKIETLESNWTIIDGINGVMIYPADSKILDFSILKAIEDYGYEGICSIDVEYGWAARYSLPGYLDCTEWVGVYDSEYKAVEHLEEVYPEY